MPQIPIRDRGSSRQQIGSNQVLLLGAVSNSLILSAEFGDQIIFPCPRPMERHGFARERRGAHHDSAKRRWLWAESQKMGSSMVSLFSTIRLPAPSP